MFARRLFLVGTGASLSIAALPILAQAKPRTAALSADADGQFPGADLYPGGALYPQG